MAFMLYQHYGVFINTGCPLDYLFITLFNIEKGMKLKLAQITQLRQTVSVQKNKHFICHILINYIYSKNFQHGNTMEISSTPIAFCVILGLPHCNYM